VNEASIDVSNDGYRVRGELNFATVRDVLKLSQSLFLQTKELNIDLSAVESADSAGLALIIEWYRIAAQTGKKIRFIAVPAQLRALAKISDVDELLGLSEIQKA
jgi:phospholipid transport system transporter-binding protein